MTPLQRYRPRSLRCSDPRSGRTASLLIISATRSSSKPCRRGARLKTAVEAAAGANRTLVDYPTTWANYASQQYTIGATQTLYNGFQTANRTRQAESQVSAGRETLRLTELNLLLQGATVYMDLLRDAATLELNKSNVVVLQEQLRQSRDRFNVGEVTKTDVAQAESR
jgi:outer membrane protein